MHMQPDTRPDLPTTPRWLAAEATASAALGLIDQPALWEALQCLALMLEAVRNRRYEGFYNLGEAVCQVVDDVQMTDTQAERVVQLIELVATNAKAWEATARRGA